MLVRSRVGIVLLVMGALLVVPSAPAAAGGSWLWTDRRAYAVGERASARGTFDLRGALQGRISDGPYVAYLLPGDVWMRNGRVPPSAIRVGELRIRRQPGASLSVARVDFVVPNVPTGSYQLGYCNEPCTVDGIGDLEGSVAFTVAPSRLEARLRNRVERLQQRVDFARYKAKRETRSELKRLERTLQTRTAELRASARRSATLEATAERRAAGTGSTSPRSIIPGWSIVAAVGILGLAIVVSRRRRRPPASEAQSPERSDEVSRVLEDAIRRG